MTDTQYDFLGDIRETTDIYKLAYVDGNTLPVATGTVPGRILNQYSMGEYNDFLRVATTVGPTFSLFGERTGPHNNVYVLGEADGKLAIVGSVESIAPRETIRSARFVGERGFVAAIKPLLERLVSRSVPKSNHKHTLPNEEFDLGRTRSGW